MRYAPHGEPVKSRPMRHLGRSQGSCAADMERAVSLLEGRWKMMVLAHLYWEEVMRYSDLQRKIPTISQKMLAQQLRALERDGLVRRMVFPEVPPRVEYSLTPRGEALEPVFFALLDWTRATTDDKLAMAQHDVLDETAVLA